MLVWISLLSKLAALHPQTLRPPLDIHGSPWLDSSLKTPRGNLAVDARLDLTVDQTRRVAPADVEASS